MVLKPYRELYKIVFPSRASDSLSGDSTSAIDLLGVSGNGDMRNIGRKVSVLNPDVLLFSVKKLDGNLIAEVEEIWEGNPRVGLALLLVSYDAEDIKQLRKFALNGEGGMALFLKQSLDLVEQLRGIIVAVSQGQVILDPTLTTVLFAEKPSCPFLRQLTGRELEILGLLSRGYTNAAIAEGLFIDVKTVEHHINSMYSKLKAAADFNDKHPRVSAARLYLEATGELLTPGVPEVALASDRSGW